MTRILDDLAVRQAIQTVNAAVSNDDNSIGPGAVDERTTAQGMFTYAEAYLASAGTLSDAGMRVPHAEAPQRALAFHAAELYLKAFLRLQGCTVSELRKFGHRFKRLIEEARDRGLNVSSAIADGLIFSDESDDVIGSRYIQTGYRLQWPVGPLLEGVRELREEIIRFPGRRAGIILWGEGNR